METIICLTLKGGVGKTETACNLAEGLANEGKRVLLIDNDPQGNATARLDKTAGLNLDAINIESIKSEEELVSALLVQNQEITLAELFDHPEQTKNAIRKTSNDNLDLIPGSLRLSNTDTNLRLDVMRCQNDRIKKILRQVKNDYDYCIIDCPPTLNLLTINALCVPDCLPIIPIKIDGGGLQGWAMTVNFVKQIEENFDIEMKPYKVLFTMATKTAKGWIKNQEKWIYLFQQILPENCFKTVIRNQASPVLAANTSQDFVVNMKANVGQDYRDFIIELEAN